MKERRRLLGLVLVVAGAMMIVDALGWFNFSWFWQQEWKNYIIPAVVIFLGARLILQNKEDKDNDEEKK